MSIQSLESIQYFLCEIYTFPNHGDQKLRTRIEVRKCQAPYYYYDIMGSSLSSSRTSGSSIYNIRKVYVQNIPEEHYRS